MHRVPCGHRMTMAKRTALAVPSTRQFGFCSRTALVRSLICFDFSLFQCSRDSRSMNAAAGTPLDAVSIIHITRRIAKSSAKYQLRVNTRLKKALTNHPALIAHPISKASVSYTAWSAPDFPWNCCYWIASGTELLFAVPWRRLIGIPKPGANVAGITTFT